MDQNALRKKALFDLRELQSFTDTEEAHKKADDILCFLLTRLGYDDVVTEYDQIDKWYA